VNADVPDLDPAELPDPALGGLVRALTADGTADELAGRPAALAMFRDSRRRPRRLRFAVSMSSAAAAVVLAGGIASAYAAVLPGPVQHIAYRMLGSIGVPDTHWPGPSSGPSSTVPRVAASHPSAPSAPAIAACGCQTPGSKPGPSAGPGPGTRTAAPNLTLAATLTRIPANAGDVFSGRVTAGGSAHPRPEAGVRVQLSEHVASGPGWRAAGSAVTDGNGDVTLTVVHLTSDASFRLTGPGGAVSSPVFVTVIPHVSLVVLPALRPGWARLTVAAPFAQAGDVVVLQELSGGVWHRVTVRPLGQDHLALFTVLRPLSGEMAYRVVIPRTAAHGRSVSRTVWLAARSGALAAGV
jgi:hypothetical protein